MALDDAPPDQARLIASRDFVLDAPLPRVWDVLPASVIQGMPVEQMDVVSDTKITAVLRAKLGPLEIPVPLRVEVVEVTPLQSFSTRILAQKSLARSVLLVAFALTAVSDDETRVTCTAREDNGSLVMRLLRWQQRHFADGIFSSIQKRLERAC
ncbi:MAG TPA: hypothetical protein VNQ99_09300 [Xanthobacteraceae bacterium]|nr:hypothetical protein [Xanthobacteraceae bacterium]